MKRLLTIFRHPDVNLSGSVLRRKACRAIIFRGDKALLVQSAKYGEYKFPGGGQNDWESSFETLKREVSEETGRRIRRRIVPFGSTIEYAKDFEGKFDVFLQHSNYYFCSLLPGMDSLRLEDYEIEYGYSPCWISLEEAIAHNLTIPTNDRIPWKERDTRIMKILMEKRVKK